MSTAPVTVLVDASLEDYKAAMVDAVIVTGVTAATCYFAAGRPGRGAYELARLAMSVNRLLYPSTQTGATA